MNSVIPYNIAVIAVILTSVLGTSIGLIFGYILGKSNQ